MKRRAFTVAMSTLPAWAWPTALVRAQAPSSAPLRIFVPVAPGGTSDLLARIVADRLAQATHRAVVVDNRTGASGKVAVDALRAASADGDALLVAPIIVRVLAPLSLGDERYDTQDLVPVAQLARFDYALAVGAQSPARSVAELVHVLRTTKGSFATNAVASVGHFAGVAFAAAAGLDVVHVPYRTIGMLETDLIGGHVTCAFGATPDYVALHRAGRIRILATTGATRSAILRDVPTFAELGYRNLNVAGWTGLFASPRANAAAVDRWSAVVSSALAEPDVRRRLQELGLEPTGTTPAQFEAIIARDVEWWRGALRASRFDAMRH